jgi:hypothetical protein
MTMMKVMIAASIDQSRELLLKMQRHSFRETGDLITEV